MLTMSKKFNACAISAGSDTGSGSACSFAMSMSFGHGDASRLQEVSGK